MDGFSFVVEHILDPTIMRRLGKQYGRAIPPRYQSHKFSHAWIKVPQVQASAAKALPDAPFVFDFKAAKAAGVPPEHLRMAALRTEKKNLREISSEVGASIGTISRILSGLGFPKGVIANRTPPADKAAVAAAVAKARRALGERSRAQILELANLQMKADQIAKRLSFSMVYINKTLCEARRGQNHPVNP